jgi:hypothetical protein
MISRREQQKINNERDNLAIIACLTSPKKADQILAETNITGLYVKLVSLCLDKRIKVYKKDRQAVVYCGIDYEPASKKWHIEDLAKQHIKTAQMVRKEKRMTRLYAEE